MDSPGGWRTDLRSAGIGVDLFITQFYQGMPAGAGKGGGAHGGRADLAIAIEGEKVGLWSGFTVSLQQEWVWGDDANGSGGTLFPVNTALEIPASVRDHETSLTLSQQFGKDVSLTVGKFNMIAMAAKTPILGGGGIDTFENLMVAAPFSGMVPPYILGGVLTVQTDAATLSLMVYDPRNAQRSEVLRDPFEDGVTFNAGVTVPVHIGGRLGIHTLRAVYSTQDGFDLSDLDDILLPPGVATPSRSKDDRWFLSYSIQQYLHQDATDSRIGWGVFGQLGISDENPNPIESSFFVGIAGSSLSTERAFDRWGIAYFRDNVSGALRDGLSAANVRVRDERGWEIFYNLAITPWLRVTADMQFITPGFGGEDAVFAGVRTQIKL